MKRFVLSVILVTAVGLTVVYGEVEAVKTGYRIRQLNLQKTGLVNEMKHLEFGIATLKTPQRLEQWMSQSRVNLTRSRTLELARTEGPNARNLASEDAKKGPAWFARIFLGTAQAESER